MKNLFKLSEKELPAAIAFLKKNAGGSMFLLTNIREHGLNLTNHPNSGNYYLLKDSNKNIKGVFVLCRRGNILFHFDSKPNFSEILNFLIKNEKLKIEGVLGLDPFAKEFFNLLLNEKVLELSTFESSEILYDIDLENAQTELQTNAGIASTDDQESYIKYIQDFYLDQKLPDNLSMDQHRERFQHKLSEKILWMVKEDSKVKSMAGLNAVYEDLGQVGSVFTPAEFRSNGFSKKCMKQLLHESKEIHSLKRIILFTAENNIAARKVYENIGFQKMGRYGMYFGKSSCLSHDSP